MPDNKKGTGRIMIQHGLLIAKIFAKKYYVINKYKKQQQHSKEIVSEVFKGKDYKEHLPRVETMESGYCYEIQRVKRKTNSHELNLN